ncbi:hypothetical protein [Streptomyces sp. NPDC057690]|uniref:hypothetical protein n=1 Tax=Streptomyces sp. NPDC057690 TaxID=3346214 RepID=UPI0036A3C510
MRLGRFAMTVVLLTPIPFMGMTESAEAFTTHRVGVSGSLRVEDTGGLFSLPAETRTRSFNRVFRITHQSSPAKHFVIRECAGDTLAELTIDLYVQDEDVLARMRMGLHQSACEQSGVEERVSVGPAVIAKDETRRIILPLLQKSSLDKAVARISVTHVVAPPLAPSDVNVTREPADRTTGLRSILVEWQDSSADEKGYEIRNTNTNRTRIVNPNRTSYRWAVLDREQQCFQVRALGDPVPSDWTPPECA